MEPRGVDEDKEKETRLEEQEAELDYDVLVETIGEFGWFQKLTCALLWIPAAVGGIHVLMYSFTGRFFWWKSESDYVIYTLVHTCFR